MIYPKLQSTGHVFNKKLLETVHVRLSNGDICTIEAGFVTNLASVPRKLMILMIMTFFILASYMAQNGADILAFVFALFAILLSICLYNAGRSLKDELAFIVHDWLFDNPGNYDRAFIDYQMFYFMKKYQFNFLRPYIMYLGVRAFSWYYFKR